MHSWYVARSDRGRLDTVRTKFHLIKDIRYHLKMQVLYLHTTLKTNFSSTMEMIIISRRIALIMEKYERLK